MTNIILCGGAGERLWPISRTRYPKQFSKMVEGKSLLQQTAIRNQAYCDKTLIVTNSEQYFLAKDQLNEVDCESFFILETAGRNTAPAITLACLGLTEDELVLVTPSDHLIRDNDAYLSTLSEAKKLALDDKIVTLGIKPNWAETGYGYIHAFGHEVKEFKEKPDQKTAQEYLDQGDYYWNSGIFMFKVSVFLSELDFWRTDILNTCKQALNDVESGANFIRIHEKSMMLIPKVSIDYALMEKSDRISMVVSKFQWSDLGSFESLFDALEKDSNGNVTIYQTDSEIEFYGNSSTSSVTLEIIPESHFITIGSHNNLIITESKKVATIDVADLIIVDTKDALLVALKSSSQKVKDVVTILKNERSRLKDFHTIEYRPWGFYTTLQKGYHYEIRSITLKPEQKFSCHCHYHSNEHWIVVNGSAEVVTGVENEVRIVCENQSVYIPSGLPHSIRNLGKTPLIMIEVQSGEYLDEDDIMQMY